MDAGITTQIRDLINKNEYIGIVTGNNPTLDTMGAALALGLILETAGKKVTVASPKEPLVEISSLVGIDRVRKELGGSEGDLVVSFPYQEGEIEKVSYTIENGFLNIVVKASENGMTFSEQDVRYKRGGGVPKLLFVIGTPRLSDLGALFDPAALKDTTVVNIDNRTDNQGFGDVVLVSPNLSSVSEHIADLITTLGFELDIDAAQNLLSGISYATDNFQKQNTSSFAFEMAGQLLKKGARRQAVQHTQPARPLQRQENNTSQFLPPVPQGVQSNQNQKPTQQQQVIQQQKKDKTDKASPTDWLTPKVYRGTNLS